jgi:hypothetical protein
MMATKFSATDSMKGDVLSPTSSRRGLRSMRRKSEGYARCCQALDGQSSQRTSLHVPVGRCACAQHQSEPRLVSGKLPQVLVKGGLAIQQSRLQSPGFCERDVNKVPHNTAASEGQDHKVMATGHRNTVAKAFRRLP